MSDFGKVLDILDTLDGDERKRALLLVRSYLDGIAIKRGFFNCVVGGFEFKIILN